jgi:acetylornithine deacetylase/succinyl-diaminopimelate desuccinylase-like protein
MNNTLEYLKKLISIPSASGNESPVADYIQSFILARDLYCKRYGNSVMCKIPGSSGKKAMILNGHIDTVKDSPLWSKSIDPHRAVLRNGKLFGLGSSDMKSGLAIMLSLIEFTTDNKLQDDVWFMFSDMEEIDGSGTKTLLNNAFEELKKYQYSRGLILEPTSGKEVCYGHRGNLFIEASIKGEGGHSSFDYESKTAADNLIDFMAKLNHIREYWKLKFQNKYLGKPGLNITKISGSESLNVVSEIIRVTIDIRYTPELSNEINREISKLTSPKVSINIISDSGYGLCKPGSYWYDQVASSLEIPMRPFSGSTDQTFFTDLGIPMLIYGPGNKNQMHKPNEYVFIKDIDIVYKKIVSIFTSNL